MRIVAFCVGFALGAMMTARPCAATDGAWQSRVSSGGCQRRRSRSACGLVIWRDEETGRNACPTFSCAWIAGHLAGWYALGMMRYVKQFRVARPFLRYSYRCIHETFDQLQECRAAQTSGAGS